MDSFSYEGFAVADETAPTTANSKAPKPLPSQEYLREALDYDAETGTLTWRERPRHHFNTDQAHKCFSTRDAGKTAGNVNAQHGYVDVRLDGTLYRAHRICWKWVHGTDPETGIDHINGVTDDNRIANLRPADPTINGKNCKLFSTNTSGVTGVSWHKAKGKWQAQIKVDGTLIHLGRYDDWFDAVCARKSADNKYGFHVNHGRRS